ncbi:MAG: magnesium transporter CorA family protein [Cellulosilyticaceae bacterium]
MKQYKMNGSGRIQRCEEEGVIELDSNWCFVLTPEELASRKTKFKVGAKTIKECQEGIELPKLEVYDQYDFGLVHIIDRQQEIIRKYPLNFYLGSTYLLLVSYEAIEWLTGFIEALIQEEDEEYYSPEKILYVLLDVLTAEEGQILDGVENEINLLEEKVIKGEKGDYIRAIVHLRKRLLYLRRHYETLLDIAGGLAENDNALFDPKATRYFRILSSRMNRLNMRVLHLEDNVSQIREAYDAQVDIGLNKIMKVFTVITVIFAPLTFIAGWYGMNFESMAELSWPYGYAYVICISIISMIGCLIYFKKKKWL